MPGRWQEEKNSRSGSHQPWLRWRVNPLEWRHATADWLKIFACILPIHVWMHAILRCHLYAVCGYITSYTSMNEMQKPSKAWWSVWFCCLSYLASPFPATCNWPIVGPKHLRNPELKDFECDRCQNPRRSYAQWGAVRKASTSAQSSNFSTHTQDYIHKHEICMILL